MSVLVLVSMELNNEGKHRLNNTEHNPVEKFKLEYEICFVGFI